MDTFRSNNPFLSGAIVGSLATLAFYVIKNHIKDTNLDGIDDSKLGPPDSDARYGGVTIQGQKDMIYENNGPFPFQFNAEVTKVFDDMVSRSVPLYREVNDFLLYWVHRYYQEGTCIVDLGCSTGTAFDLIAKSYASSCKKLSFVGVDNSEAMIKTCKEKLAWFKEKHDLKLVETDIINFQLESLKMKSSFVLLNYTLQFLSFPKREKLLKNIFRWMVPGGVLFLSEKLDFSDPEVKEMATFVYEDFKHRRGYSKTEIARKKEALMNVLVSYTEPSLKLLLKRIGFVKISLALKWNNFGTFIAFKPNAKDTPLRIEPIYRQPKQIIFETHHLDTLFDYQGEYLLKDFHIPETDLVNLFSMRQEMIHSKGNNNEKTLRVFDKIAKKIIQLSNFIDPDILGQKFEIINLELESQGTSIAPNETLVETFSFEESQFSLDESGIVDLCDISDLKPKTYEKAMKQINKLLLLLMPWKKGPFRVCDILVDAEWRSDLKWNRFQPWLPSLKGKVVCDIGCNNGYFMFRMIEDSSSLPKLVVGIEPNLNCLLQFQFIKQLSKNPAKHTLKFEHGYGDMLQHMPKSFDVIFCLGILYHTTDPIKLLRDIHKALKPGGVLFVDCQGIVLDSHENEPIALFPKKRYANMKGVYFLPNMCALKNWLSRSSFKDVTVIFSDKLSTKEQRVTKYAPVNTSLKESLKEEDQTRTIEDYPAPYRFYLRARKG